MQEPIYIVDGARTPFLKAQNRAGPFSAADLAVQCGRHLLHAQAFSPELIDEVIVGCMLPSPHEATIGRIIGLRLGLPESVPGWTVQRNCASGMQAIDSAIQSINTGRSNIVLAGGTDAMSRAPILLDTPMANWLGAWMSARSLSQKLRLLTHLRPKHFKLVIALLCGLTDPVVGLNMGQTAENLAHQFNITREAMDAFAVQSHHRLAKAFDNNSMQEVVAIIDSQGRTYTEDTGMRRDSSLEKLATLKPYFDKTYGRVTAANSSQITDGAALLILASETAVKEHKLPVLARITDSQWRALDPAIMGLGPVHAATPILLRNDLDLNSIDLWEINEAFAAQVLACIAAWDDDTYCRQALGLKAAMGTLDQARLNTHGGAVAAGHPIGASGARIVLRLAHSLKAKKAKRGIAAICIGGGQGGAMLLEQA